MVTEQVKVMREDAEHLRIVVTDGVAEERANREAATDSMARKMDAFTRLYETERERIHKSVRDALAQMFERTNAVQDLAKNIQKDGIEVKRVAVTVQVQTPEDCFGQLSKRVKSTVSADRASRMCTVKRYTHATTFLKIDVYTLACRKSLPGNQRACKDMHMHKTL
jgi:hypothetical protein